METPLIREYAAGNYWLRLLKANWIGLVVFALGCLVVLKTRGYSAPIIIGAVLGFAGFMFVNGSFSEARFALIRLVADANGLYIKCYDANRIKEMNLPWNEIDIQLNYHEGMWFRKLMTEKPRPVLTIQNKSGLVFQLYSGMNPEIGASEINTLVLELMDFQSEVIRPKNAL